MSRYIRHSHGLALLALVTLLAALPGSLATGQPAASNAAFVAKAQRLETSLLRRPRAGSTFDLWRDHYLAAGKQPDWLERAASLRDDRDLQPESLVIWGLVCEQQRHWQDAEAAYESAADASTDHYPLWRLAEVLLRQAKTPEAISALRAALDRNPPRIDLLPIMRQLAQLYEGTGKVDDAVAVYEQLAERFPQDARLLAELARQLAQADRFADALAMWQRVTTASRSAEDRFEAELQIARLQQQAGDTSASLASYERLLDQVDPTSWRAEPIRQQLNRLLEAGGTAKTRVEFWEGRTKRDVADMAARRELGQALAAAGRLDDAQRVVREALDAMPEDKALQEALVQLLVRTGSFDRAIEQLEALIKRSPKDASLYRQLGELHLRRPDVERHDAQRAAARTWQTALDAYPDDARLAAQLAAICTDSALSSEQSALSVRPQATMDAAAIERNRELLEAAEAFWEEAIRRDATAASWNSIALLQHRIGKGDAAVSSWSRAAELNPRHGWLDAARIMLAHGYPIAAVAAAEQATVSSPESLEAWQQLIQLQLAQEQLPAARRTIDRMLQVAPDDMAWRSAAFSLRARVQLAAGQADDAQQQLRELWQQSPPDIAAGKALGVLLQQQSDNRAACEVLENVLKLQPGDHDLRRQYAQLLSRIGRTPEAIDQYQRLVTEDRKAARDDYQRLIDLQLANDRVAAARESAEQLLRKMPRDAETHLLVAEVARAANDPAQHLAALERAVRIAPDDLQVRRRYAMALRESAQNDAAFREATAAILAAKSADDQQSLLAWVMTWGTPGKLRELADRLSDQQSREADRFESATWCLVSLYRHLDQPDLAIAQLRALQLRQPTDRAVLQELVRLLARQRRLAEAIPYQQLVVRLDGSPAAREQLARLLRQDGQTEAASRIWDQVLDQQASVDETLRLLLACYQRQDLYAAQQLAEANLSRFPESATLAYHAALIHLALEQVDEARRTFEQLAIADGADVRGAKEPDLLMTLDELRVAVNGHRFFLSLLERQQRFGIRHPRTIDFLFDQEDSLAPATAAPSATRLYSALALLVLARADAPSEGGADPNRIAADLLNRLGENAADDGNESPARITESLGAAAWAVHEYDACLSLIAKLESSLLSNWLHLLTPPVSGEESLDYVRRLRAGRDGLTQAAPAAAQRDLAHVYVGMLAHCPDANVLTEQAAVEVEGAESFADIVLYAPLMLGMEGEQKRVMAERLLDRLLVLPTSNRENESPGQAAARGYLLEQLASWETLPTDRRHAALQRLFPGFATSVAPAAQQGGGAGPSPRASLPTGTQQMTTPWHTRLVELQRELAAVWQAQRSLERSRGTSAHRFPGRDMMSERAAGLSIVLESLPPAWPPGTDEVLLPDVAKRSVDADAAAGNFSAAPPWLDANDLRVVERIAPLCITAGQQAELMATVPAVPIGVDASLDVVLRSRLMRAALLWSWQRPDDAIGELQATRQSFPQNNAITGVTLHCMLAQNRFVEARQLWHRLPIETRNHPTLAPLGERLWRGWSDRSAQAVWEAHAGAVLSLAMDPQHRYLASAGVDGAVRIWDLESGQVLQTFHDHQDIVLAVAFSHDGSELASGGHDRNVHRRRVADWSRLESLRGHEAAVRCLDYHPAEDRLVSGGDDRRLIAWDLPTAAPLRTFTGHSDMVLTVSFAADGKSLASTGNDRTIRTWQWAAEPPLVATGSTTSPPRGLARGTTPDTWWTGGDQNELTLWQSRNGITAERRIRLDGAVRSLVACPTWSLLAIGRDDHVVQLWDPSHHQEIGRLIGHTGRVMAIVPDPARNRLVTAGFDGTIRLWSLADARHELSSTSEATGEHP